MAVASRASATSQRHAALPRDELARIGPGLAYFAFGDFSALDTATLRVSAAPWVLTTALLALQETGGDPAEIDMAHVEAALRRSGFLYPETIGNWPLPALPPAQAGQPLGQNLGHARRLLPPMALTIGNLGCAACHAGVMYDAKGRPDPGRAWLGTPNTSLNLGAYTRGLYRAMRDYGDDDTRLWAAIDRLYPGLEWRERLTLRMAVLPELRRRTARLEAAGADDLLPFTSGTPGATYTIPVGEGQVVLEANANYSSSFIFEATDPALYAREKGHTTADAFIHWDSADERWRLSLWAKNLTNERYRTHNIVVVIAATPLAVESLDTYAPPPTIGVDLTWRFGQ